jgi:hypothetical protein
MYTPRGSYKHLSPVNSPLGCKPKYSEGHYGNLFMHDVTGKLWQLRYFALLNSELKYYIDESCTTLEGSYKLNRDSVFSFLDYSVSQHSFIFTIEAKSSRGKVHELYLSAPTNNDRHVWHEVFKEAVHGGGTLFHLPDIWQSSFIPTISVDVNYNTVSVDDGNVLQPYQLTDPPAVKYSLINSQNQDAFTNSSDLYTLILVDLDFPQEETKQRKKYIHWMRANVSMPAGSGEEVRAHNITTSQHHNIISL